MSDYRPSHADITTLAIGVVISVLVNLLTSYDFNEKLTIGMLFILGSLVCCLLYYFQTKKGIKKYEDDIKAREDENGFGLKQIERYKLETKIWETKKNKLTSVGWAAVVLGIIGLFFSFAWRVDIHKTQLKTAETELNITKLAAELHKAQESFKVEAVKVKEMIASVNQMKARNNYKSK